MHDPEIYIRQTDIIDPAKLDKKIAIIGAGSIGGWTAICLGKLGCQDITVYDFDQVDLHNAGSQVFKASDSGLPKVEALQERLKFLLESPIKTVDQKWTKEVAMPYDIIILAVDNITTRKEVFEALAGKPGVLLIDGRMAANAIEVYTAILDNQIACMAYGKTLFAEEETLPIACSARAVVYNVFVVAGIIGDLVAKHANGQVLPHELIIDLENFMMFN